MRRFLIAAALLAAGTPAPTAPILSELERQRLVAHLDMTERWLTDEVSGLSPAQLSFRPAPGTWTILENLEHLVIVGPIYWQDLQKALKTPPRQASREADADMLWYGIDRTRRGTAIPGEQPTGQLRDVRAGLEAFGKEHARLRQYIRTTTDDLRGHIVDREGCDAYQWAVLISAHVQRHILQIREVKRDPRFPKR